MFLQVSTTKGTGGDVIILEEAAYCDPGFFYETVAPLMLIGRTSLLAISTLTSEINFYSRLIKMKDSLTQVYGSSMAQLPINPIESCLGSTHLMLNVRLKSLQ
jgi:hypothetical protein